MKQAGNVVELLEYFSERREPASLAEIADDMGWPRSSTFNLVGTLVEKGYLYEPRRRGGYFPSPRWALIVRSISDSDPVDPALETLVDTICARTGETTALGCASGQWVSFLYVCESRQPIRYFAEVGTRVPIHASSAGRAILSLMSKAEREAIYRKLEFERFSDTTPMGIERIQADLRAAAARGYHQSNSEYINDLAGVSYAIQSGGKRLSVVTAGPVSRCLDRRAEIAGIMAEALEEFGLRSPGGGPQIAADAAGS